MARNLTYSKEKPTEPGYYCYKYMYSNIELVDVVRVYEDDGVLFVETTDKFVKLSELEGEFSERVL